MLLPTQLAQPASARDSASHRIHARHRILAVANGPWPSGQVGRGKHWDVGMLSEVERQTAVILRACPCRYSGPFLKAVSEKQAPGYRDVVKR